MRQNREWGEYVAKNRFFRLYAPERDQKRINTGDDRITSTKPSNFIEDFLQNKSENLTKGFEKLVKANVWLWEMVLKNRTKQTPKSNKRF